MEKTKAFRNKANNKDQTPHLNSQILAAIALGMWLCSLPLAGIVLYSNQREISGGQILAMGWLGILLINFAWIANPLFILTFFRINGVCQGSCRLA
jgi:hypothetical protein